MNAIAAIDSGLIERQGEVVGVKPGFPVPLGWDARRWHVAQAIGPHAEAEAFLHDAGCLAFSPAWWVRYRPGGKGVWLDKLDRPLAGYVFVAGDDGVDRAFQAMARQRRRGLFVPVAGFLGAHGRPAAVSGFAMAALFELNARGAWCRQQADANRPLPKIGEKVRAEVGAFADVNAVVSAVLGRDRVEIMVQLFGKEHAVRVPLDKLVVFG